MNEISLPKHLLIPVVITFLSLIFVVFKRKKIIDKINKNCYISILFFLFLYLFIVGNSLFQDIYCQWNLNKYDLNNDGFFSGNEINENQKIAMKKMINDNGRKFSFISGFILSFVISFFLYLILGLKNKLKNKTVTQV